MIAFGQKADQSGDHKGFSSREASMSAGLHTQDESLSFTVKIMLFTGQTTSWIET